MEEKKETNINKLSIAVNGLVGTVDKLAEMTQRGFESLRNEFKNEIRSEIGGLRGEMKNEISGLRDELRDEMSEKFDRVLSGQDKILKRSEDLETDNVMSAAVHRRQDDKLENHEKRIVVVEDKVLV